VLSQNYALMYKTSSKCYCIRTIDGFLIKLMVINKYIYGHSFVYCYTKGKLVKVFHFKLVRLEHEINYDFLFV